MALREDTRGVAGIVSHELTKGYGSIFGIGGAFRDMWCSECAR